MHPCSEAVPCAAALTWRHDTQQNQLIGGQGPLQALLLLIAFISVPMMLLPKPFLLKREHEAKVARRGGFQPLGHEADEEAGACLLPPVPAFLAGANARVSCCSHPARVAAGRALTVSPDTAEMRHPGASAGGGHGDGHGDGHDDEFEFGEVMVHQMIHTIEYVLGTPAAHPPRH